MSSSRATRRSASTHRSSIFPLPNATKPRHTVSRKLEFNELPDDILLAVFRHLSPIDLLNIALVSRRWYAVSQDHSLWRTLANAYGLQQPASTSTAKQSIQTYLNNHIRNKLKSLFPTKFDPFRSYTGMADYQKTFQSLKDPFHFLLAFCDERHQVVWSQKCDTMKLFDTSMSLRWFDLTMPQCLSRVQYLRLFAIVSIDMHIGPHRTALRKLSRHTQRISSLLREYTFHWNTLRTKARSLTAETKSTVRISTVPNEDDYLVGTYDQDQSYAFLTFNINYLAFHDQFFVGLRSSTSSSSRGPLSQRMVPRHLPTVNDMEVSVFLCLRNMTTTFLRHRFPHCRLKSAGSSTIELIRITDMTQELGPELEQLPKFNWKTGVFNGTINDVCLIDLVVLNERSHVSFSATLPATLAPAGGDARDLIVSSNVWHIKAVSQCHARLCLDGVIMRHDSDYCALGRHTQSWHLQTMTCSYGEILL